MTSPSDAGLQTERTGLAWTRTALGVAGNAVLLALHEVGHAANLVGLVPACLAMVITIGTAVYGWRRISHLRHAPLPRPLAARVAIPLLGWSVAVLAVLSAVVQII